MRFFRFTLRDLLWLTVVLAMAVGWWTDRTELLNNQRTIESELEELRFKIELNRFFPQVFPFPSHGRSKKTTSE